MRLSPYGDRAVLIEEVDSEHRLSLMAYVQHSDELLDVRLGMTSVTVIFDSASNNHIRHIEALLHDWKPETSQSSRHHHDIDVDFNGDDLSGLAQSTQLTVAQFIDTVCSTTFSVELMGFAPGFPYLKPDNNRDFYAQFPRLATPRTRVPEGSVAVAAGMACIYPAAMPGGWNLIGTTNLRLFDAHSDTPALLSVGDTVRFWGVTS